MSLLSLYSEGFGKSLRAIKVIALFWVISVAGQLMVWMPLRRNLAIILDGSIIPELFYDGFYLEIFNDIMHAILPALTSFSISFFLVITIVFLANTFLTAGLFRVLAGNWKKPYRRKTFLLGADRGFGGFLFIAIVTGVILILLLLILILLPLTVAFFSMAGSGALMITGMAGVGLFLILLPVIILTADYARVLLTEDKWMTPSRAMTDGFRYVRRSIVKGWPMMSVLLGVSFLAGWAAFKLAASGRSQTGVLWFILPVISQTMFFVRIWVRIIRYGTVTALHEE